MLHRRPVAAPRLAAGLLGSRRSCRLRSWAGCAWVLGWGRPSGTCRPPGMRGAVSVRNVKMQLRPPTAEAQQTGQQWGCNRRNVGAEQAQAPTCSCAPSPLAARSRCQTQGSAADENVWVAVKHRRAWYHIGRGHVAASQQVSMKCGNRLHSCHQLGHCAPAQHPLPAALLLPWRRAQSPGPGHCGSASARPAPMQSEGAGRWGPGGGIPAGSNAGAAVLSSSVGSAPAAATDAGAWPGQGVAVAGSPNAGEACAPTAAHPPPHNAAAPTS